MVGRTRLYQRTGSPLIQGYSMARRKKVWPWVLLAIIIVIGVSLYFMFLR